MDPNGFSGLEESQAWEKSTDDRAGNIACPSRWFRYRQGWRLRTELLWSVEVTEEAAMGDGARSRRNEEGADRLERRRVHVGLKWSPWSEGSRWDPPLEISKQPVRMCQISSFRMLSISFRLHVTNRLVCFKQTLQTGFCKPIRNEPTLKAPINKRPWYLFVQTSFLSVFCLVVDLKIRPAARLLFPTTRLLRPGTAVDIFSAQLYLPLQRTVIYRLKWRKGCVFSF